MCLKNLWPPEWCSRVINAFFLTPLHSLPKNKKTKRQKKNKRINKNKNTRKSKFLCFARNWQSWLFSSSLEGAEGPRVLWRDNVEVLRWDNLVPWLPEPPPLSRLDELVPWLPESCMISQHLHFSEPWCNHLWGSQMSLDQFFWKIACNPYDIQQTC